MNNLKRISFGLLWLLISVNLSLACTLRYSLDDLSLDEYGFVGKVVGYAPPAKIGRDGKIVVGLKIQVLEAVNLPGAPQKNYEVYPLSITSFCGNAPAYSTRREILKTYKIGDRVVVLASQAGFLAGKDRAGRIRLESRLNQFQDIAFDEKSERSADSIFDFKKESVGLDKFSLKFEIFKEFARLEKAASEDARKEILERLLDFAARRRATDFSFQKLVEKYITSAPIADELNKKYVEKTREKLVRDSILQ